MPDGGWAEGEGLKTGGDALAGLVDFTQDFGQN
jgi:hypothetical protein